METLIKLVLKLLAGITADQWRALLALVLDLANSGKPGAEKKAQFDAFLAIIKPGIATRAIDAARTLAVLFATRKGWIAP